MEYLQERNAEPVKKDWDLVLRCGLPDRAIFLLPGPAGRTPGCHRSRRAEEGDDRDMRAASENTLLCGRKDHEWGKPGYHGGRGENLSRKGLSG